MRAIRSVLAIGTMLTGGLLLAGGARAAQPGSAYAGTSDPYALDEPTIIIDVTWEASADLILVYGATLSDDPVGNPFGAPSASWAAGCGSGAVVSEPAKPLVLTVDPDLDPGVAPSAREPGNYSLIGSSNSWCVYWRSGEQQVDSDRLEALAAVWPEGKEFTVTFTVNYVNIPGKTTETITGKVPVYASGGSAEYRSPRVLGTVALPARSGAVVPPVTRAPTVTSEPVTSEPVTTGGTVPVDTTGATDTAVETDTGEGADEPPAEAVVEDDLDPPSEPPAEEAVAVGEDTTSSVPDAGADRPAAEDDGPGPLVVAVVGLSAAAAAVAAAGASGVGNEPAVGSRRDDLQRAANSAASRAATERAREPSAEPPLDVSLFPSEPGDWWLVDITEAEEASLPPVFDSPHNTIVLRVKNAWFKRIWGGNYLSARGRYDTAAEAERKRRGVSLDQERMEIIRDAPDFARRSGDRQYIIRALHPSWLSGRFVRRDRFDIERADAGLPPLTREQVIEYRNWANRWYSLQRREYLRPGKYPRAGVVGDLRRPEHPPHAAVGGSRA